MSYTRVLLAGVCAVSLMACSDSGSGSGSDSGNDDAATTAAAVTGLCGLVTAEHVTALFGPGFVLGEAGSTETTCSYEVDAADSGSRGRIYLGGSGISYDKTVADSTALGQPMTDVDGLGARAHFTADATEQQYWIVIENGSGTSSVLVQFKNGAVPPADDALIAGLSQLATDYLATA